MSIVHACFSSSLSENLRNSRQYVCQPVILRRWGKATTRPDSLISVSSWMSNLSSLWLDFCFWKMGITLILHRADGKIQWGSTSMWSTELCLLARYMRVYFMCMLCLKRVQTSRAYVVFSCIFCKLLCSLWFGLCSLSKPSETRSRRWQLGAIASDSSGPGRPLRGYLSQPSNAFLLLFILL